MTHPFLYLPSELISEIFLFLGPRKVVWVLTTVVKSVKIMTERQMQSRTYRLLNKPPAPQDMTVDWAGLIFRDDIFETLLQVPSADPFSGGEKNSARRSSRLGSVPSFIKYLLTIDKMILFIEDTVMPSFVEMLKPPPQGRKLNLPRTLTAFQSLLLEFSSRFAHLFLKRYWSFPSSFLGLAAPVLKNNPPALPYFPLEYKSLTFGGSCLLNILAARGPHGAGNGVPSEVWRDDYREPALAVLRKGESGSGDKLRRALFNTIVDCLESPIDAAVVPSRKRSREGVVCDEREGLASSPPIPVHFPSFDILNTFDCK